MWKDLADWFKSMSPSEWTVVGGLILGFFMAVPKATGPLQQAVESALESKRRTSVMKDDADIADLRRQVDNLTAELDRQRREISEMRADFRRRDLALHAHYPWDVKAYQLIVQHVGTDAIEPPPALWPVEPETSMTRGTDTTA